MAIRIGVQADSQEECVEGLELLVAAGFIPVMLPKLLTDNRWMARAVPRPPTQGRAVEEPAAGERTARLDGGRGGPEVSVACSQSTGSHFVTVTTRSSTSTASTVSPYQPWLSGMPPPTS